MRGQNTIHNLQYLLITDFVVSCNLYCGALLINKSAHSLLSRTLPISLMQLLFHAAMLNCSASSVMPHSHRHMLVKMYSSASLDAKPFSIFSLGHATLLSCILVVGGYSSSYSSCPFRLMTQKMWIIFFWCE